MIPKHATQRVSFASDRVVTGWRKTIVATTENGGIYICIYMQREAMDTPGEGRGCVVGLKRGKKKN